MNGGKTMKKRIFRLHTTLLASAILLTACNLQLGGGQLKPIATPSATLQPEMILGVQGDGQTSFPGIPWIRLSYPTCVESKLRGQVLKDTIQQYHQQGIHVLLSYCQFSGSGLFDTNKLNDAAQGGADAVQCGNEQMKQSTSTTYIKPEDFARFFVLCRDAMHTVRPNIPIILGAMDPLVVPNDNAKLATQVQYLNEMQVAMNASGQSGGKWDWHSQILGLIDSWHNGYPDADTNNLAQLFGFWAQQLHVSINSGDLGKHLWVIEGTGCVNGCGIDASSAREIAISHILTMITDVQTAIRYQVPFFYFSGKDFFQPGQSQFWPMGVLDANGHPKPLHQDLSMGSRTLEMSCSLGKVRVETQDQLLAKLYSDCKLPGDYVKTLQN
jgi:hypothetical protein